MINQRKKRLTDRAWVKPIHQNMLYVRLRFLTSKNFAFYIENQSSI